MIEEFGENFYVLYNIMNSELLVVYGVIVSSLLMHIQLHIVLMVEAFINTVRILKYRKRVSSVFTRIAKIYVIYFKIARLIYRIVFPVLVIQLFVLWRWSL